MGLFDKVKKAFGSNEEETKLKNIADSNQEEVIHENDKNFKYLDNLIHSGAKEIVLDSDIALSDSEIGDYRDGIELDIDGLIIDGNGHEIDARGKSRIFYCRAKNITIRNITLKNGHAHFGGAIRNNGDGFTITESTLAHNTANRHGGAIINYHNLTISKSTLEDNIANEGGAIYNNQGKLKIIETALRENRAEANGGAIHNWVGETTITKSSLEKNTANGKSGAIHNYIRKLSVSESLLRENTAKIGGAIHNGYGGEAIIKESELRENTADNGGAIDNNEGSFKIFDCEIGSNKSESHTILNEDSMEIHNCNFNDNESRYVILNDGESSLGIFNGIFINNLSMASVLKNNGKFCSIEKTAFENNNSTAIMNYTEMSLISPKIKGNEGTILNESHMLLRNPSPNLESLIYGVGEVEIVGEPSLDEGYDFGYLERKIHESTGKEIILDEDIIFGNHEMDYYEGGIELDMDGMTINGNGRTIDGRDKSRIFLITGNNITLKNIIFKNGRSHKNYDNPLNSNGGAIKINNDLKLTIENCSFINNTSEEDGGAIRTGSGELNIIKSTLTDNKAKIGGAISNGKGILNVMETELRENTSQEDGGAISNEGKANITESKLMGNTAGFGGAINNSRGELSIAKSSLSENMGKEEAGAIRNMNGKANIMDCILTDNKAIYGGAIGNCWENAETIISESTLAHNTGDREGGAIFNEKGLISISQSAINENVSKGGGAIRNYKGNLRISTSTLKSNFATRDGGAINNYDENEFYIIGCELMDNRPNDMNGSNIENFD